MTITKTTQKELDKDMTTLGKRICDARKAAELTPEQLADVAGVSKDTIERCERGELGYFISVYRIAKVLGISLSVGKQSAGSSETAHDLIREIKSRLNELETFI